MANFSYKTEHILVGNIGNNALSYEKKLHKELSVAALKNGTFEDIKEWKYIAFEEYIDGKSISCKGLDSFVRIVDFPYFSERNIPITVCDNHNHVLAFWYEAFLDGTIEKAAELIHIDEHSDLWENKNDIHIVENPDFIQLSRSEQDEKIYKFTNYECNVGNYIEPAIRDGLIGKIVRIENEYQIDECMNYTPNKNSILNLDLDFFAEELDFIDFDKKIRLITHLLPQVRCITIATSPYFIDLDRALGALSKIIDICKKLH